MTLLMMDGFDHYTPGDSTVQNKWTLTGGGGGGTWGTATGRVAGLCLSLARGSGGGNNPVNVTHALTTTQSTLIIGFAYRSTLNTLAQDIVSIDDLSTGTNQIQLRGAAQGQIAVFRNGTQIGSTSTIINQLVANAWQYIEVVAVIAAGTAGSVAVYIDTVLALNITATNTQGSTTTNATRVVLGDRNGNGSGGSSPQQYDDFYLCNTGTGLGSTVAPLGDSRVVTTFPSANSADVAGHDQWALTGGTAGNFWTGVNDNPQNGDTSYLSSSTVNQIASFAYGGLPANTTVVRALQFNITARTDDATVRQVAPTQRNGSTDSVGPTSPNLPGSYLDEIFVAENSFQTGIAWTVTEVNTSEFGVKLIT